MRTSTRTMLTTLAIAIPAFLTESHGPLGSFWAPAPTVPVATGVQIPLFMFLGVTEAVGLGLAVSLILYGSGLIRHAPVSPGLARATQWSIAWFLGNWWAHD